jgi:predicted DNA-binding transcriptional regulator AlpA
MTETTSAPPQWLTMPEVLKRLHVSRQTLWLWIGSGYFPEGRQFNPTGTRLRWPEAQVTAWMDSRPVGRGHGGKQYQQQQLAAAERLAAGLPPRPVLLPKAQRGQNSD